MIILKSCQPIHYYEDCQRIVRVLAEYGFLATIHEAQDIWMQMSAEQFAMSFYGLPESDLTLLQMARPYFEAEE